MEKKDIVTIRGNPVTLVGSELKIGDNAPDFTVVDGDMKEISLKNYDGKIKVISVAASLDTPVCDMQARRFNQEAARLPDDVIVLNVTMDLPFAIKRFCTTAGIDKIKALSDYRNASFGNAYGVLIKELRLLARSIFVIDRDNILQYMEIVPELTNHPNYDNVFDCIKKVV